MPVLPRRHGTAAFVIGRMGWPRLPLPLDVVVPRGFEHHGCSKAELPCYADARLAARLRLAREGECRILGIFPSWTHRLMTLEDAAGHGRGTARHREGTGRSFHPPIPPLELVSLDDAQDTATATWTGFEATVRDANGSTIGAVGMKHALSNAFELRDATSDSRFPVRRLTRGERGALEIEVPPRRDVIRLDGSAGGSVDARLLAVWAYALAMRDAQR